MRASHKPTRERQRMLHEIAWQAKQKNIRRYNISPFIHDRKMAAMADFLKFPWIVQRIAIYSFFLSLVDHINELC